MKIIKYTILFICVLSPSFSYSEVTSDILKKLKTKPTISIDILQSNDNVTSPFDVTIKLANYTEKDIFVEKISILLPSMLIASRNDLNLNKYTFVPKADLQLESGAEYIHTFHVPIENTSVLRTINTPHLLTFIPSKYYITTNIKYATPPSPSTVVQKKASIELKPTLTSIMLGGLLGAILLALFSGTYRLNRGLKESNKQELVRMAILSLAGGVCSIIAIILLYRLQELALPINLTVNDFYGGIVIGLFSYKIGDILYEQFFEESK